MLSRLLLLTVLLLPLPAAAMQIDRVVSPGGIEAWLVQDHTIPAISLEFTFRGGAALDPPGKEGAAGLLGSMMIEGAGDLDSQHFQSTLEDLSIGLNFDAGLDTFGGSLRTLTENLPTGEKLLKLAMTQPRFEAQDFARVKTRVVTALRRAAEEPRTIASQTWMAAAFPGHPYGRPAHGTPESVQGLTVDDLRQVLGARLARDNLIVGASGDITPEALGPLLDRVFGDLPAHAAPANVPDVKPQELGETIVVRRAVPQSVVTFGQAGLKRDDPDFYVATIVNYILGGGGFNSRLMEEVRDKRGLAYSVYTYLAPQEHSALWMGGTATENSRVKQSVELIRSEWKRFAEQGPTEDELKNAKTYLTGSFALQLDSMPRIARLLTSLQYDHLGIDYIEKRNGFFEKVTVEDARRVAKRFLEPDHLLAVVVGQPEGLDGAPAPAAPNGGSPPARAPAANGRGG